MLRVKIIILVTGLLHLAKHSELFRFYLVARSLRPKVRIPGFLSSPNIVMAAQSSSADKQGGQPVSS